MDIYDVASGQLIHTINCGKKYVKISNCGTWLMDCHQTIDIWNVMIGQLMHEISYNGAKSLADYLSGIIRKYNVITKQLIC